MCKYFERTERTQDMTDNKKTGRILPVYGWLPLAAALLLNTAVYNGSRFITGGLYHYNLETAPDRAIPLVPWTVLIYFGCYLFWLVNYVLCIRQGREEAYRFLGADFLAKCICLLFFLFLPTTNVRPEITGTTVWDDLMRILYRLDAADNLFPSIHCLTSWMCYIGIRGRKNVPFWYRACSCVMAVAVFVSTLTTKQHVLADVAGGVLLAELCYAAAARTHFDRRYGAVFERLTQRLLQRSGRARRNSQSQTEM